MSDHELPPLPDDVKSLLAKAQHGAPPPPPGTEAVILAKVSATVAAPLFAGLGVTKFALALVAAAAVGAGVVVVAQKVAAPAAPDPRPASALVAPAVPAPPAPPPLIVAPIVVAPVVVPPLDVTPTAPITIAPISRAGGAAAAPVDSAPSLDRETEKAEESALVEAARAALERGDGDLALRKLQQHEREYPRGKLTEERRALTVVALSQQGETAKAKAAAQAFTRDYPGSLFRQTVSAVIADDGSTK